MHADDVTACLDKVSNPQIRLHNHPAQIHHQPTQSSGATFPIAVQNMTSVLQNKPVNGARTKTLKGITLADM
jgi:hypothetical protein